MNLGIYYINLSKLINLWEFVMERFFLEVPSINRKKDALDYLNEIASYNSEFNGLGGLEACLDNISYEKWIVELENKQNVEYAIDFNRVLSKTYFL